MAINNNDYDIMQELDMRIDSLHQSMGNDNARDYDKFLSILSKYTENKATELTALDLIDISEKDMEDILDIVGISKVNIPLIMRQYSVYIKAIKDRNSINDYNEAYDFMNNIAERVCDYANEYVIITNDRSEYMNEEIEKFSSIKKALSGETGEVVTDIESIDSTLGNMGITTDQRWKALETLAKNNANLYDEKTVDLETHRKVSVSQYYVKKYFDLSNKIADYIEKNGIDVDLIPLTAEKICSLYGIDNKDIVINVLVGVLSGSYYNEYQETLLDNPEKADKIKNDIDKITKNYINEEEMLIHEVEEIVDKKYETIINAFMNKEDIYSYNDIYLSDYTFEEDYEEAKNRKLIPIVYSLSQTLDTYNSDTSNAKEKSEAYKMIESLSNAYHEINDKKFDKKLAV